MQPLPQIPQKHPLTKGNFCVYQITWKIWRGTEKEFTLQRISSWTTHPWAWKPFSHSSHPELFTVSLILHSSSDFTTSSCLSPLFYLNSHTLLQQHKEICLVPSSLPFPSRSLLDPSTPKPSRSPLFPKRCHRVVCPPEPPPFLRWVLLPAVSQKSFSLPVVHYSRECSWFWCNPLRTLLINLHKSPYQWLPCLV